MKYYFFTACFVCVICTMNSNSFPQDKSLFKRKQFQKRTLNQQLAEDFMFRTGNTQLCFSPAKYNGETKKHEGNITVVDTFDSSHITVGTFFCEADLDQFENYKFSKITITDAIKNEYEYSVGVEDFDKTRVLSQRFLQMMYAVEKEFRNQVGDEKEHEIGTHSYFHAPIIKTKNKDGMTMINP